MGETLLMYVGVFLTFSIGLSAVLGLIYLFGPLWNVLLMLVPVIWMINFLHWWGVLPALFWFSWWGNYFNKKGIGGLRIL